MKVKSLTIIFLFGIDIALSYPGSRTEGVLVKCVSDIFLVDVQYTYSFTLLKACIPKVYI